MECEECERPGTMLLQSAEDTGVGPVWLCDECGFSLIAGMPSTEFILQRKPGKRSWQVVVPAEWVEELQRLREGRGEG